MNIRIHNASGAMITIVGLNIAPERIGTVPKDAFLEWRKRTPPAVARWARPVPSRQSMITRAVNILRGNPVDLVQWVKGEEGRVPAVVEVQRFCRFRVPVSKAERDVGVAQIEKGDGKWWYYD